ncbi:MAG: nucleotidyltransferase family protein, partial [bacterium]
RLRRFADVDVVVRQADVAGAEAVLVELGYRPGGVEEILAVPPKLPAERQYAHALTRRFQTRWLAAYSWYPPSGGALLPVDLHWHVAPARLHVPEAALWAETTATRLGATQLLTFTPAATLIHLAVHATTALYSGFRLMHLCDVGWAARLLAEHEAPMWRLADAWRVRPHVTLVFDTVERALGIELPFANAPHATRRLPPQRIVDAATAPAFLIEAPSHKKRPLRQRLGPELIWSVAMGSLRRNLIIIGAVAWARARFRWFRWRRTRAAA